MNRLMSRAILGVAVTCSLLVAYGYTLPPQPDEGAPAHLFQMLIVLVVPLVAAFVATADRSKPVRALRPMVVPMVLLGVTFFALYYLEHYR